MADGGYDNEDEDEEEYDGEEPTVGEGAAVVRFRHGEIIALGSRAKRGTGNY